MVAGVPLQNDDNDVSQAISLYNLCKTFSQLPQVGAIFDQDSYLMWVLTIVDQAYIRKENTEQDRQRARMKGK